MFPLISIYTPTHNTKPELLGAAYKSLLDQTIQDWEWIICDDGSDYATRLHIQRLFRTDPRITLYQYENSGNIGLMKKRCTEMCNTPYVLELDHDDRLVNTCLAEVITKFEDNPDAGMVYSNFVELDDDGVSNTYKVPYWRYNEEEWNGLKIQVPENHDFYGSEPELDGPNTWHWAIMPNHVRAFRRSTLYQVGGYDERLVMADDYDLILRMFLYSKIVHIDKMLYVYRMGDNTWTSRNKELQGLMSAVRNRYIGILPTNPSDFKPK